HGLDPGAGEGGLPQPHGVEARAFPALDDALDVPVGFAVPEEKEAGGLLAVPMGVGLEGRLLHVAEALHKGLKRLQGRPGTSTSAAKRLPASGCSAASFSVKCSRALVMKSVFISA